MLVVMWISVKRWTADSVFILFPEWHQCEWQNDGGMLQPSSTDDGGEKEPKFVPSGNDKDLASNLERDIVQRNPKVSW